MTAFQRVLQSKSYSISHTQFLSSGQFHEHTHRNNKMDTWERAKGSLSYRKWLCTEKDMSGLISDEVWVSVGVFITLWCEKSSQHQTGALKAKIQSFTPSNKKNRSQYVSKTQRFCCFSSCSFKNILGFNASEKNLTNIFYYDNCDFMDPWHLSSDVLGPWSHFPRHNITKCDHSFTFAPSDFSFRTLTLQTANCGILYTAYWLIYSYQLLVYKLKDLKINTGVFS